MKLVRAITGAASIFLAAFIVANFAGGLISPGFPADYFWILPLGLPGAAWLVLKLALAAIILARIFIRKPLPNIVMFGMLLVLGAFLAAATANVYQFYRLLHMGAIRSPAVVPFSFAVILLLLANAVFIIKPDLGVAKVRENKVRRLLRWGFSLAAVGCVIPLGLIMTMGPTDYTRYADVAIILGAKANPDGTPSLALGDRVNTGIELYKEGLVRKLIMTGGTGSEGVSEPEVMKRLAVEAGVPDFNIILDRNGINTSASACNCRRIMESRGFESALAVSHYFHTPRIKLLFQREGVQCYVVPAKMTRRLIREPYHVFRECVALYYHYFLTWKRS